MWPVLMACTWKNAFCLQRSGTKYRYFIWAKRRTAWRAVMVKSARSIALLLASFYAALPSEREKLNRLDDIDFPFHLKFHALSFAWSVSRAQVAFSSEPSRNLLCATILDIISTICAYVLSLGRARSPPPHTARDRALAAAGPSTIWRRESQWVSIRAAGCSY